MSESAQPRKVSKVSANDARRHLAVALDTSDRREFRTWCRFYGPRVGVLKVGLEAFVHWGAPAVREAVEGAREVFLDLKLHDIPNTVAGAVSAARSLGVRYLTVHAAGGESMLRHAVEAGADSVRILAVTLLTHLDTEDLAALDLPGKAEERVRRWAALARRAGCSGVVCSPLEVARLRQDHPEGFLLVTPGIRPAGTSAEDQRRVTPPGVALVAGADLLVVGRPLTRAANPEAALEAIEEEMVRALLERSSDPKS